MICSLLLSTSVFAADDAKKKIEAMDRHLNGDSFQALLKMEVKNSIGDRSLKARVWNFGRKMALVKILEPSKDRNSGNLRNGFDLWQYLSNVDRVIKIPANLMLQSWMGSDFTNDDLVRGSSLVRDYTHKTIATEKWKNMDTTRIECTPLPTAPVVWGKVIVRVRTSDSVPLEEEFYSEKGTLLKIMEGSDIQSFGSHTIPTTLVQKTIAKGSQTTIHYSKIVFDEKLDPAFFTQQTLKKPVHE